MPPAYPSKKPKDYRDADPSLYIFFDYIGVHNDEYYWSRTGLGTAKHKEVSLVLDFQKILSDFTDYYDNNDDEDRHKDIRVSNDYINFIYDLDEITIWSFSDYYEGEENINKFKTEGTELVIQYEYKTFAEYFNILPYLVKIVVNPDHKNKTRSLLNNLGLNDIKVETFMTYEEKLKNDGSSLSMDKYMKLFMMPTLDYKSNYYP